MSPQSESVAQPLPTRDAPQMPLATLQLAEAQSASCVHLGRQRPPFADAKQSCSTRQSELAEQLLMQSLTVELTPTHAAFEGQAVALAAQSLVQYPPPGTFAAQT